MKQDKGRRRNQINHAHKLRDVNKTIIHNSGKIQTGVTSEHQIVAKTLDVTLNKVTCKQNFSDTTIF